MGALFTATLQVDADRWLSFHDPLLVLQADTADAVRRTLVDVEQLTRDRGLHAVGFLTYEAGSAFGLPASARPADVPLAWFALYEPAHVTQVGRPSREGDYSLGQLTPSLDRAAFRSAFSRIKEHLAAGDSYQANFTFTIRGAFSGDAASLFADLVEAQQGQYSACIDLGDVAICSASPELFFELEGASILARPMKGTARRGRTLDEDRTAAAALASSAKEQAENVMIVDMVRNDLGRVADVGSVEVPELFRVERFPNVWQMTSLVKARCLAPLDAIVAALHPSASVTGAPKVRTMELLAELEGAPRGVYTGAIGHVPPDGLARFNVAIRTAVVDRRTETVTFGVGSGVVWDSTADAEYDECLLKAGVLGRTPVRFELLETLLWSPADGYVLLEPHIQRLADSAEYFGVPISATRIRNALVDAVAGAQAERRVRLLVARDGTPRTESQPHEAWPEPVPVALALAPVDPDDRFLFHKTTNRGVYEQAKASRPGYRDVILWNSRGELTETTMANLVLELDGALVTPPVSSGLLPGTYRAEMLARGQVVERVVRVEELRRATRVWLVNSVQGQRVAQVSVE